MLPPIARPGTDSMGFEGNMAAETFCPPVKRQNSLLQNVNRTTFTRKMTSGV